MRRALGPWFTLAVTLVAWACTPAPVPSPGTSPGAAPGAAPRVLAYSVITVGRHAGEAEIRIEADGSRSGHYTFNDRGRGPDIRTTMVLDGAGAPRRFHATGHDYFKAPVDERLDDAGGTLRWARWVRARPRPADPDR